MPASKFTEELEMKVTPSPDQVPPEALEEMDEEDLEQLGSPPIPAEPA